MTVRLVVLRVTPRPVVPRMMRRLVVLRAMFRLAVLRMLRPVVLRVVIRPAKILALLRAQTRTLATSIRTAARPLPQRIFRATLSHMTGRPTKCADAEIHCDHCGHWITLHHKINGLAMKFGDLEQALNRFSRQPLPSAKFPKIPAKSLSDCAVRSRRMRGRPGGAVVRVAGGLACRSVCRDGGWATEVVRRNWKGLEVPKHAPGRRPC